MISLMLFSLLTLLNFQMTAHPRKFWRAVKRKKDGCAHTARTQSAVRGGQTRDRVGIGDILYVLRWRSMSALRRKGAGHLKNTVVKSALSSELVRVTAYLLMSSGGAINFSKETPHEKI